MIRVFPRKTKWTPDDDMSFVGLPPLIKPDTGKVKISVTFTWDIPLAYRLLREWKMYYNDVQIGGPAFGSYAGEFKPGLFVKKGVTITSRGCNRMCKWCLVPERESNIRELKIKPGWIVQDNNLLQCSSQHIEAVFDMLRYQKNPISFNGGLDSRLLTPWHVGRLACLKIKELWFSCDTDGNMKYLKRVSQLLDGININKKRCYVLIGFNSESLSQAENRLKRVYKLGFLPFAQLYKNNKPINWNKEWKQLARKWSRPAIYRSLDLKGGQKHYHSGYRSWARNKRYLCLGY